MTLKPLHLIVWIIAALLIVGGGIALSSYIFSRVSQAALAQLRQDNDRARAEMQAAEAKREEEDKRRITQLEDVIKAIPKATPQQIIRTVPEYVTLPQPITTIMPAATPENPKPEPQALVPMEDMRAVLTRLVECKECDVRLAAAQANSADDLKRLDLMTGERDKAVQAVKGGSFWTRFKRDGKSAIGATAGAAGGAAICSKSSGPVIAGCAGAGALVGLIGAHL